MDENKWMKWYSPGKMLALGYLIGVLMGVYAGWAISHNECIKQYSPACMVKVERECRRK